MSRARYARNNAQLVPTLFAHLLVAMVIHYISTPAPIQGVTSGCFGISRAPEPDRVSAGRAIQGSSKVFGNRIQAGELKKRTTCRVVRPQCKI